jgi:hypothetical protein
MILEVFAAGEPLHKMGPRAQLGYIFKERAEKAIAFSGCE